MKLSLSSFVLGVLITLLVICIAYTIYVKVDQNKSITSNIYCIDSIRRTDEDSYEVHCYYGTTPRWFRIKLGDITTESAGIDYITVCENHKAVVSAHMRVSLETYLIIKNLKIGQTMHISEYTINYSKVKETYWK